jgi:hypothetical protein
MNIFFHFSGHITVIVIQDIQGKIAVRVHYVESRNIARMAERASKFSFWFEI